MNVPDLPKGGPALFLREGVVERRNEVEVGLVEVGVAELDHVEVVLGVVKVEVGDQLTFLNGQWIGGPEEHKARRHHRLPLRVERKEQAVAMEVMMGVVLV